eukprot:scaffold65288_cov19-Tisochrysis_lutea.AAC.2
MHGCSAYQCYGTLLVLAICAGPCRVPGPCGSAAQPAGCLQCARGWGRGHHCAGVWALQLQQQKALCVRMHVSRLSDQLLRPGFALQQLRRSILLGLQGITSGYKG